MSMQEALSNIRRCEHGFDIAVPDTWLQGRTAYGGFSAAVALSAAMKVGGKALPPLRSAVVSFVGPGYGTLEARARVLRRGKNAIWISAELTREGEVTATATFVFMGPVDSALQLNDYPAPIGLNPPEDGTNYKSHPLMPAFMRENFEARFAVPKSDTKQPELCWWVRLKDRSGLDPMSEVLLIGDALPPGVLPLLEARVPVSSMTWQVNLLTAAPITRDGWFLLRARGDYAENGCSSQTMGIWNADGAPVASGMQSIAVFG